METATLVGLSDETYELLDKLGEGGFGAVYLARKHPLRKLVALKVLDHRVSAAAERRLWDEALVLASLRHPGIVAAEDLVRFRGQLGLVTEYVEGEDLSACLADGLPASALVEAIGQVAWALHAAAQRGVVHRDVKPQNVRIGRHGNAKLLDFGIASAEGIDSEATALMGTPRVMAPERFRSESGPPSDVFSLGCILWLGLTSSHFYGEAKRFEEILPLTRSESHWKDLVDAWPTTGLDELDQLALSMVAHRAEDRPTAAEVGRRCEALVDLLPRRRRLSKWCRDRWPDGVEVPRPALAERTASSLAERGPSERGGPVTDDPTGATEFVAPELLAHHHAPPPDDFVPARVTSAAAPPAGDRSVGRVPFGMVGARAARTPEGPPARPEPVEVDDLSIEDLAYDVATDEIEPEPEPEPLDPVAIDAEPTVLAEGDAEPTVLAERSSEVEREPAPLEPEPPVIEPAPLPSTRGLPEPVLPRPLVARIPSDEAPRGQRSPPGAVGTPLLAVGAIAAVLAFALVLGAAGLGAAWYASSEVATAPTPQPLPPPVSSDVPTAPTRRLRRRRHRTAPAPTPPAPSTREPAPASPVPASPSAAPKPVAPKPAAPKPAPGLSDPAAVRAMVTSRMAALSPGVQSCGASTTGRWHLTFSVLPSGETGDVSVAGVDRADAAVEICVSTKVAGWRFDPVAQALPVSRTLRFP